MCDVKIWVTNPLERVRKDAKAGSQKDYELFAAKNEYESYVDFNLTKLENLIKLIILVILLLDMAPLTRIEKMLLLFETMAQANFIMTLSLVQKKILE